MTVWHATSKNGIEQRAERIEFLILNISPYALCAMPFAWVST
jgi:hypothetical protein